MSGTYIYDNCGKPLYCIEDDGTVRTSSGRLIGKIEGNYIKDGGGAILGSIDTFDGRTVFRDKYGALSDPKGLVAGLLSDL